MLFLIVILMSKMAIIYFCPFCLELYCNSDISNDDIASVCDRHTLSE